MKKTTVLQVCVAFVLCSPQVMTGSPVDCPDQDTAGTSCSISMEKLLERAVQHAELIYRVSEESKLLFDEMLISNGMNLHIPEGNMCAPKTVPVPLSKSEIQQISDKWILHSLLILAQFWIDPLAEVQASLENYENAPSALLTRSKWMSTKLMSLEQGITVLIRQILGEGSLKKKHTEDTSDRFVSSDMLETVRRDYSVIYCFRKDAHKMQTFLKLLKCRQIDKENCSLF
ncbi:somatolactin beta [Cyprinus carpio]|uniref:Somatolactin beta n=1 Tax=Cyprinus carpio TaxID=7962 RepID=A0A9Q9WQX4_CYPCA|nr:somatolactin beta [Cyprinus carpio]